MPPEVYETETPEPLVVTTAPVATPSEEEAETLPTDELDSTPPAYIPVANLADQVPLPTEPQLIQLEDTPVFVVTEPDVIIEPPAGETPELQNSPPATVPEVVVARPPMAVKTKGAPPAAAPASATPAPSADPPPAANNVTMGGTTSKNETNAPASFDQSTGNFKIIDIHAPSAISTLFIVGLILVVLGFFLKCLLRFRSNYRASRHQDRLDSYLRQCTTSMRAQQANALQQQAYPLMAQSGVAPPPPIQLAPRVAAPLLPALPQPSGTLSDAALP